MNIGRVAFVWLISSVGFVVLSIVGPLALFELTGRHYAGESIYLTEKTRPHWRVIVSQSFGRRKIIATSSRILGRAPEGRPSFWYDCPVRAFRELDGFEPRQSDYIVVELIGWPHAVLHGSYMDQGQLVASSNGFSSAIPATNWAELMYQERSSAMYPYGIQLRGLWLNGGFGGTVAVLSWLGVTCCLQRGRQRRGQCEVCGYSRQGARQLDRCPECGFLS